MRPRTLWRVSRSGSRKIQGPETQDICYATENRQMAVKGVAEFCELLLVVGSRTVPIRKRLVEVCENFGVRRISCERLERGGSGMARRRSERSGDGGRIRARKSWSRN